MDDRHIAIIGGGVIGGGWAARFALNGWRVKIYDLDGAAQQKMEEVMANARNSLPLLADNELPKEGELIFCSTLKDAVQGAEWIQESTPERLEIKHSVYSQIQDYCSHEAIIGSSTSGFKPSQLRAQAVRPWQIIVAHPYNPVYLLPIVELVSGEENSGEENLGKNSDTILRAKKLLETIGMKPVIIAKEIDAHIGDRLLEAVWREALWLIKDNIATTAEIDDIITHGFGLRWAQMGLFETYRLAGGKAGMRHFIAQFGPALAWPWTKLMDVPELDDLLVERIASQSDKQSGHHSIRDLEQIRDRNLVGFLKLLKDHNWAAGATLNQWSGMQTRQNRLKAIMGTNEGPFTGYHCKVLASWIDYNGHMTEFRYLQVISEASDYLLAALGLDEDYIKAGFSIYTAETHIRHLAEAKLGEEIHVSTQILSADQKKIRLWHDLVTQDGQSVATGEQMWLHVDMQAGSTTAMRPPLADNLASLFARHQNLPMPHGAGRSIGQKT